MRLLADENIYDASVTVMRAAGHDVLSIREEHRGMIDALILALAVETERILVTRDRDFGGLVFLEERPVPPAVIYVRLRNVRLDAYGRAVVTYLDEAGEGVFGKFVTITSDGIRERVLIGT